MKTIIRLRKVASYPETPNLNFDILHKDFDPILSEISKFQLGRKRF